MAPEATRRASTLSRARLIRASKPLVWPRRRPKRASSRDCGRAAAPCLADRRSARHRQGDACLPLRPLVLAPVPRADRIGEQTFDCPPMIPGSPQVAALGAPEPALPLRRRRRPKRKPLRPDPVDEVRQAPSTCSARHPRTSRLADLHHRSRRRPACERRQCASEGPRGAAAAGPLPDRQPCAGQRLLPTIRSRSRCCSRRLPT